VPVEQYRAMSAAATKDIGEAQRSLKAAAAAAAAAAEQLLLLHSTRELCSWLDNEWQIERFHELELNT
jgi:hypothetical protein